MEICVGTNYRVGLLVRKVSGVLKRQVGWDRWGKNGHLELGGPWVGILFGGMVMASRASEKQPGKYRADVDGMRALAVVLVVLNHVGLGFAGG